MRDALLLGISGTQEHQPAEHCVVLTGLISAFSVFSARFVLVLLTT